MDVRERVVLVLSEATLAGEHLTFRQLVQRVAWEGECLNCLGTQVRKAVNKLEDEGFVALSVIDGV